MFTVQFYGLANKKKNKRYDPTQEKSRKDNKIRTTPPTKY